MKDFSVISDEIHRYDRVRSVLKFGERKPNDAIDLTIVIPTYKRTKELDEALASIFEQHTDFRYEVIVCDNEAFELAGTEKEQILYKYRGGLAYYQNEENIGLFGNWNRCIWLASTKWVAMLHDDDCLADDYFDKLGVFWQYLQSHDVAYVKALSDPKGKRRLKRKPGIVRCRLSDFEFWGPSGIGQMSKPSCGTLFHRDSFIKAGGFNESFYPDEDAYFVVRMVKELHYPIFHTTENMGCTRSDESVSFRTETLLKYASQFKEYLPYYRQWGIISHLTCALFFNELIFQERAALTRSLSLNEGPAERDAFVTELNKILPNATKRPVHMFLYRKLRRLQRLLERLRRVQANDTYGRQEQ